MQFVLPLPQFATGVFQNLIELKYAAGAFRCHLVQLPFSSLFMNGHAFLFAGVSPNESACCACTFGVDTHLIHMTAQFGCLALVEIIHVSAQPVAPSFGIRSATGALAAWSVFVWYGHDAPTTAPPFLNRSISSPAEAQYFLTSGCCRFSSATVALNCESVSSYGSLIPRPGCVFDR